MTKKEEITLLIDKYDVAYSDYLSLKKFQIIAILLFFIGGFILFIVLNNKKRNLNTQKREITQMLDAISSEITTDEYLEIKQRIILIGRQ